MLDVQDPQYKSADGSALRIFRDVAENKFASQKEGRLIVDECIYVEVISPGSKDSTPVIELVRKFAKEANHPETRYGPKYPEYKNFVEMFEKDEHDASMAGTPLSQWKELSKSRVAELKSQGFFTIDALAAFPDSKLAVVGPDGRTLREKAKAYIEQASGSAVATKLAADLERERANGADLQRQLIELSAKMEALQAAQASTGVQELHPALVDVLEAEVAAPTPAEVQSATADVVAAPAQTASMPSII